jgi:signal transduction histidine kinase
LVLSLEDFTRLESTVEEMLTLARLEQPFDSHRLLAPRQFCSLRDTIEDAVQQGKPFAQLKSVEIAVDFSGDVSVPIDGRDALLLCSNILLNALQHSPEGAAVRIAAHAEERTVRLTVEDQGPGISGEDQAHIFEPFYRGDPSRSRKSGGTGLGLSICKAICERVGGSIEIANRPAGGALVTVRLPAKVTPSPSIHSASLKAE